ncbi:MAG: hypothetical protein N2Z21_08970 [Candidatus Sumerlaeaceae bacterium]|nr:hypothetical protein [Candidatus Sumerlaeaceae bacterium]
MMRFTTAAVAALSSISLMGSAATLFTDSFNSTTLGPAWSASGTNQWRVRTSTTYRNGTSGYGVTLDDSVGDNVYSTSRLDLKMNLATYSNVVLTFRFRNVGEENDSSDGLFLSTDNGATFSKIWSFPAISSTFSLYTVNVSSAAASIGKALGPNCIIRWQQYDNYPLSSDGVALDDVTITGDVVASTRSGVGAIPYTNGTTFRVWAPNASAVAVAGSFNG